MISELGLEALREREEGVDPEPAFKGSADICLEFLEGHGKERCRGDRRLRFEERVAHGKRHYFGRHGAGGEAGIASGLMLDWVGLEARR